MFKAETYFYRPLTVKRSQHSSKHGLVRRNKKQYISLDMECNTTLCCSKSLITFLHLEVVEGVGVEGVEEGVPCLEEEGHPED